MQSTRSIREKRPLGRRILNWMRRHKIATAIILFCLIATIAVSFIFIVGILFIILKDLRVQKGMPIRSLKWKWSCYSDAVIQILARADEIVTDIEGEVFKIEDREYKDIMNLLLNNIYYINKREGATNDNVKFRKKYRKMCLRDDSKMWKDLERAWDVMYERGDRVVTRDEYIAKKKKKYMKLLGNCYEDRPGSSEIFLKTVFRALGIYEKYVVHRRYITGKTETIQDVLKQRKRRRELSMADRKQFILHVTYAKNNKARITGITEPGKFFLDGTNTVTHDGVDWKPVAACVWRPKSLTVLTDHFYAIREHNGEWFEIAKKDARIQRLDINSNMNKDIEKSAVNMFIMERVE